MFPAFCDGIDRRGFLRVGSLAHELLPHNDRLRGSDRDERRQRGERNDDGDDGATPGSRQGQHLPDPRRPALGGEERGERQRCCKREQRVERRQKREPVHQYPVPTGVAPRPRPNP